MKKERCIVHANCQGEPLIKRLLACPAFAQQYDIQLITNYTREPVPEEQLGQCSLFLYQFLGTNWGELASERLLEKLPDNARSLCVPNMFFKGYWPTWSGEPGFDYRCTYLDEFIAMGLPPEETALLYLRSDVTRKFDLLDLAASSIALERERETHTPVKYVDLMVEKYRDARLFNTVNHPCALLMNHATRRVLEILDYEPPKEGSLESLGEPFPEFEQPVNPKIAEFFGWEFATAETQYNIYGRQLTFALYVANYVLAQKAGIEDFIGFLQGDQILI